MAVTRFKKNFDLVAVFAVSVAVGLTVVWFDRELGINFLTEIGGVAITVFVIDRIIERRERQKRISIDQRILRDIQAIVASYFSIWKHIAWQYFPDTRFKTSEDVVKHYPAFVNQTILSERFKTISIHHPESWDLFFNNRTIEACFENYYSTLTKQIQRFIDDFKIYIEPELLNILLNVMECQYFKELHLMPQPATKKFVIDFEQDPDRLESYLRPEDLSHLQHFIALMEYSASLQKLINEFAESDIELYEIEEYFKNPELKFV